MRCWGRKPSSPARPAAVLPVTEHGDDGRHRNGIDIDLAELGLASWETGFSNPPVNTVP